MPVSMSLACCLLMASSEGYAFCQRYCSLMMCVTWMRVLHVSGLAGVGQRLRDLDDRHGEAVAGVHVAHIIWGHKAHMCVNEVVVDECGICECAHLCEVVEHHNEYECGVHCMGCGW